MFNLDEKRSLFSRRSYLSIPILMLWLVSSSLFVFFANYNHQRYISQKNLLNEDILFFSHTLMRIVSSPIQFLTEFSVDYTGKPSQKDNFYRKMTELSFFKSVRGVVVFDRDGHSLFSAPAKKEPLSFFDKSSCLHCGRFFFHRIKQAGLATYAIFEDKSHDHFFLVYALPLFSSSNAFNGAVLIQFSIDDFLNPSVLPPRFFERYKILYLPTYLKSGDLKSRYFLLNEFSSKEATVFFENVALHFKFMILDNKIRSMGVFLLAAGVLFALILIWSFIAFRVDMKRRENVQNFLYEQQGFMKNIENSLMTGLFAVDLNGKIVHVNASLCRLIGYPETFLLNLQCPFYFLLPAEESLSIFYDAIKNHIGVPHPIECFILRRTNEKLDVLVYVSPLLDLKGFCMGNIVTILDIHEKKKLQHLMNWQQKRLNLTSHLVAVGETASFLAHELNQPLGSLVAYATALQNGLENGEFTNQELTEIVQKIVCQSEQAGDIVRRVYGFVRRHDLVRISVDLRDVLRRSAQAVDVNMRENNVVISFDCPDFPCSVLGDSTLLVQVLINLLKNAISAIGRSPRRVIEMSIQDEGMEYVVRVRDYGPGIPQSIQHKIFDAFVTTSSEGMGLGLSICRTIIENHQGKLDFETDFQEGTVFMIHLMKDTVR